ncbi:MAG: hypothetical protein WCK98_01600 [bacterium]
MWKKQAIALFGTLETIKMLLSLGLVSEAENGFASAEQILDKRQKSGKFLKISTSAQKKILNDLN